MRTMGAMINAPCTRHKSVEHTGTSLRSRKCFCFFFFRFNFKFKKIIEFIPFRVLANHLAFMCFDCWDYCREIMFFFFSSFPVHHFRVVVAIFIVPMDECCSWYALAIFPMCGASDSQSSCIDFNIIFIWIRRKNCFFECVLLKAWATLTHIPLESKIKI